MGAQLTRHAVTLWAVAAVCVAVDQGTKLWALTALEAGQVRPFIGSFISLQLVSNPGAAFSFLSGATWLFTLVAGVVCALIIYVSFQVRSRPWALCLGILLGGAVGNLVDRITQPPAVGMGHVVDFLNWNGWFVGNVADIFIVLAAAGIFGLSIAGIPFSPESSKGRRGHSAGGQEQVAPRQGQPDE
ncbi:signal peptidase II [Gleimia hominis]|uniref:Lipoprotein signal peptidase n=1 Tax=Gleimia hominis TaxID=595468 RepID=A0ABU3ICK3_9ACTO|nr:signal peptidase II [Gleimia hominis]MDT3768103.1 signal peptidase II [Gleimia hominis]